MPRHRAQRREECPDRGVPVSTAPRLTSRPLTLRPLTARLLAGRRPRSLFVTPWFAAGVGVMIAATLVLESPTNAVLSYGPSPAPCLPPNCATISPQHVPDALATAKPGGQLNATGTRHAAAAAAAPLPQRLARPAHPAHPAHPAPAEVSVSFRVVQHDQRGFIGVITLVGSKTLGDWTLGFRIPGSTISGVGGASWQRNTSGDGGVARGQLSPWLQPRSVPRVAKIVVFGTGTPASPAACSFDGRSCSFS